MIKQVSKADVPKVQQPIKQRRPESAFAKRQVAEFLASGCDLAEITEIPAAYNITSLYAALGNALWSACNVPRSYRVMRRGSRLFLMTREVADDICRDGFSRTDPVA